MLHRRLCPDGVESRTTGQDESERRAKARCRKKRPRDSRRRVTTTATVWTRTGVTGPTPPRAETGDRHPVVVTTASCCMRGTMTKPRRRESADLSASQASARCHRPRRCESPRRQRHLTSGRPRKARRRREPLKRRSNEAITKYSPKSAATRPTTRKHPPEPSVACSHTRQLDGTSDRDAFNATAVTAAPASRGASSATGGCLARKPRRDDDEEQARTDESESSTTAPRALAFPGAVDRHCVDAGPATVRRRDRILKLLVVEPSMLFDAQLS